MTLVQLQAFVAVTDARSFTAASEVLGMTQSAVSHALANLEAELGVSLLERERNGVFLTEIGKRVVVQAREMLARAEQIRQETAAAVGLEAGKIRIGSFPSVSAYFLPRLLRQFRHQYPGLEVVLFEGTDQEVREWITSRAVDVGVIALPTEGLEAVPIATDEFLVVVAQKHSLAQHTHVCIEQIASYPFIMSNAGCKPVITGMFRKAKVIPRTQFEVIDLRTIFAMVTEGMGVTIVPQIALPANLTGLSILHLEPKVLRHLAFAVPSLQTATPAVTMFLQQARIWAHSQGYL